MRGGEKCVEALCECFPEAEIFTLIHGRGLVSSTIEGHPIHTSFLQFLPSAIERYQYYLPLMPAAIAMLRVRGFDCIISSSAAISKAVSTPEGTLHICYCYTPMRYIWDQFDEYFGPSRARLVTRVGMTMLRRPLQWWDVRTSSHPHYYIGISENVRQRIERIYRRPAEVIYPPVDTGRFSLSARDDGYYLVVSALVPYKRIDLAIQAVAKTGDRLIVVGDGNEMDRLRSLAGPTVEFTGWISNDEIRDYYAGCRAVLFPGEEDFGIVPVEAMATGKPVIAFGHGGALETVVDRSDLKTGVLFSKQKVDSMVEAFRKLSETEFDPVKIRQFALGFDKEVYKSRMRETVQRHWAEFGG
jgi:glycosyltransferase involved in cell wall biosynthesis